jgi:hypothetical protein
MRKNTLLAAATLILLAFAAPAYAASGNSSNSGSGSSNSSDEDLSGGVQVFDGNDDATENDLIHKNNVKKHHDLEDRYGENYGRLPMPPLAIKPGKAPKSQLGDDEVSGEDSNLGVAPLPGSSQAPSAAPSAGTSSFSSPNTGANSSITNYVTAPVLSNSSSLTVKSSAKMPAQINPGSNSPIILKDLKISGQTPAADFMNESLIWAGMLGAAAVALGGIVGFTTIRSRKSAKDEFIYEP